MMKYQLLYFVIFVIVCFLFLSFASAQTTDTLSTIKTDNDDTIVNTYNNVDLVEETKWGDPAKIENVDVVVKAKDNDSYEIVVIWEDNKKLEIQLIEGVVVKIFSHNTHKLIHTYATVK